MSKAEFTKGPYKVKQESPDTFIVRDSRGAGICSIRGHRKRAVTRAKADAHLLAAAPEMYDLLDTIENDAGQVPQWLWDRIQTTLAKARGEAT